MQLKVLTYNLHSGNDRFGKPAMAKQLENIRAVAPDVAGFEEVAVNHPKSPSMSMPEELKNGTGLNLIFGKAFDVNPALGYEYGVAAAARFPIEFVDKIPLPTPEKTEPRVFTVVKVLAKTPFYLIVTHFSYRGEFPESDAYRAESARLITKTVREKGWFPAILTGDLNSNPESEPIRILHEDWDVCNDLDRKTVSCYHPDPAKMTQIDYICTYPKSAFRTKELTFTDDMVTSDHKPVVAVLEML